MDSSRSAWKRFEKTGDPYDYLAFCEARRKETSSAAKTAAASELSEKNGAGEISDQSSL